VAQKVRLNVGGIQERDLFFRQLEGRSHLSFLLPCDASVINRRRFATESRFLRGMVTETVLVFLLARIPDGVSSLTAL
jgi:hypothetical protein